MITLAIKSTTATSCHKGQWLRSTTGLLNNRFSGIRKQQCRSNLPRGTFSITLENHTTETNITCLSSSWVILNKEKDELAGPAGRAEKSRVHLLTTINKHVWGTWWPKLKPTDTNRVKLLLLASIWPFPGAEMARRQYQMAPSTTLFQN